MTTKRTSVVAVLSLLTALTMVALGAVSAQAVQPAQQKYYWEWSDDVEDTNRIFPKSVYKNAAGLPQLVVLAEPADPRQRVVLQFKQDGKWQREDAATTNANGIARLSFDPICRNGKWCEGTYKYRFLVNDHVASMKIEYTLD